MTRHSVMLLEERCKGCTLCVTRCPTEAIRVRGGKAFIITERCIDCGECIRVCPHHAKSVRSDALEAALVLETPVAMVAPSFYGQFKSAIPVEDLLGALKSLGFAGVEEVALGAEIVTEATARILEGEDAPRPLISSSCPAVVRLVEVRFPALLSSLVPLPSPMEVTARLIKRHYGESASPVFITPCPAKITDSRHPLFASASSVAAAVPVRDLFAAVVKAVGRGRVDSTAGKTGILWGRSGGESRSVAPGEGIAVDGIRNVSLLLEKIDSGNSEGISFIEAMACPGGCVGGALQVENPFMARSRLAARAEQAGRESSEASRTEKREVLLDTRVMTRENRVMALDADPARALEKLERLEALTEDLPALDCGSCGAPNCRALAEDIVQGRGKETDCVFVLRSKIRKLTEEMIALDDQRGSIGT
ncbi:[Fe-Fe] hydrogenase large subunit C-terminal domain-containing protein [Marispirochaeta aestuarii]|uniref:[Fe-Fe] hydrogenase large subunit C-terminal domain-containing protein n=1 Tax=Marispirochaeta aestuarii TaxID=1963862 RepID=UPI0029C76CC5|nr:[Fe-Fe] hydrogenase large subunit C-terminal domain-containing protein [Marispirochaeta aestuarii]